MKKEYTVDEIFPSWKELIIGKTTKHTHSFIDVRDLEFARGHGFRYEKKEKVRQRKGKNNYV